MSLLIPHWLAGVGGGSECLYFLSPTQSLPLPSNKIGVSVHGLGEQHEEPGNEDPRIRSKCPIQRRGAEGVAEPLEPCTESDRKRPAWEVQGTFDGAGVEKARPRPPG